MVVIKPKPKPEKTAAVSPTSTYRVPAGSTVIASNAKGTTVANRVSGQVDLKPSSYAAMNSPAPQSIMPQVQSFLPPRTPTQAFFGAVPQPLPQSFLPPLPGAPQQSIVPQTPFQAPQAQPRSITSPPMQQQAGGGGEGGQANLPQAQAQKPTFEGNPVQTDVFGRDYTFPGFKNEFWTPEGQGERLNAFMEGINPFKTSPTGFGGNYVPGASEATTVTIQALNAASLISGAAAVFKYIQGMNKLGQAAMTVNGAKQIASTTPAATGTLPWLEKAGIAAEIGAPLVNPKTGFNLIQLVKALPLGTKLTTVGGILTVIGFTASGVATTKSDKVQFIRESGDLQLKLYEAGLYDMANELYTTNKDLEEGFDQIIPYIPGIGKAWAGMQLSDAKNELYNANREYEALVKDRLQAEKDAEKAKADAEAAADKALTRENTLLDRADARAYQEAQTADTRAYQEETTASNRAYQEQQTADQRAYNEGQASRQAQADYNAEATATETSQPSSLTFGLLGTSGATEFVDRDKASQVYFGKPYAELTPEQLMLLNLLKGKGGE